MFLSYLIYLAFYVLVSIIIVPAIFMIAGYILFNILHVSGLESIIIYVLVMSSIVFASLYLAPNAALIRASYNVLSEVPPENVRSSFATSVKEFFLAYLESLIVCFMAVIIYIMGLLMIAVGECALLPILSIITLIVGLIMGYEISKESALGYLIMIISILSIIWPLNIIPSIFFTVTGSLMTFACSYIAIMEYLNSKMKQRFEKYEKLGIKIDKPNIIYLTYYGFLVGIIPFIATFIIKILVLIHEINDLISIISKINISSIINSLIFHGFNIDIGSIISKVLNIVLVLAPVNLEMMYKSYILFAHHKLLEGALMALNAIISAPITSFLISHELAKIAIPLASLLVSYTVPQLLIIRDFCNRFNKNREKVIEASSAAYGRVESPSYSSVG
ncbi:MAG: hypothetical protein GXO10_06205 [Crenarchaeota archaeon]|nr:hypothetical protein [Thermoproteota archaeon]